MNAASAASSSSLSVSSLAPAPLRTRDVVRLGAGDRSLRRRAERGGLVRLVPGTYVERAHWEGLSEREQYVARCHAQLLDLPPRVVASHWSAAAVWGFPVRERWPTRLEAVDAARSRTNSSATLLRRPGPLRAADTTTWQGRRITRPARTAVDLALAEGFETGVLVFDHGLHAGLFTRDTLIALLLEREGSKRFRAAEAAVAFASPDAEWPGESFSRMSIPAGGLTAPALQEEFSDDAGLIGRVDFWWADAGVVGEFDGEWKYSDERFLRGRSALEVIRDEKRRQARLELHPLVKRVVPWDFAMARRPEMLAARLLPAGVRRSGVAGRP